MTETTIKPKIGKNVLGCVGILIGMLVVFGALAAFAVAKTGIVRVPFFSQWYHGPTPTRLVSAQSLSPDAFRVMLASRFVNAASAGTPPPYVVRVSEKELTGALMGALESGVRDPAWKQVFAQAVIRTDGIEVFLKLEHDGYPADFSIRFMPVVESGGVRFDPVAFQFGDYPLPVSAARRIAGLFFSRDFGFTAISVGEAYLSDVRLGDGGLEITAAPRR